MRYLLLLVLYGVRIQVDMKNKSRLKLNNTTGDKLNGVFSFQFLVEWRIPRKFSP